MIRLWRGFHSPELLSAVRDAWSTNELLVLCPPYLESFNFCRHLPEGAIELGGEWGDLRLPSLALSSSSSSPEARPKYSAKPVLGVFTSGTVSGEPRLVLYTRENINASLDAIFGLFDATKVEQIFCYAQPFHTFGLLLGYVLSLKLGVELITPEGKYSSASHDRRLALTNPNLLTLGTPAHFYDLISVLAKQNRTIAPSYSCIAGGASVSVGLWNKMRDTLQIEAPSIGYGCTEAAPGITHLPPGLAPKEDGEIGFALSNLNSVFSADGVDISGPSLCLAIIDSKGVDFSKHRMIYDKIRTREDGVHVFEGRTDLVINRGGEKISPEVLESSMFSALGVEALCVPVPNERLGSDLAFLVEDGSIREQTIEHFAKNHRLRIDPTLVKVVEDFPRNASFKPNRKEAAAMINSSVLATNEQPTLPVDVRTLAKWIPHRDPMIWIDQITDFNAEGGEAVVTLKEDALYMTDGQLRPTATIEFVAQTYGFVAACQNLSRPAGERSSIQKAFLVGIRNADLDKVGVLRAGTVVKIRVGNVKFVGPVQILDGHVSLENGETIAAINLKLYSE